MESLQTGGDDQCAPGHSHPRHSRLWISCRPSNATLYVLLSCDHLPLEEAQCKDGGMHQSQALVTAAALSNIVVVLMKKFPEEVDVLTELLYPSINSYGSLLPESDKREETLFRNVLVPVSPSASLDHDCSQSTEDNCCSRHFKRLCKDKTWQSCNLRAYFGAVQPVCSRNPARTIRNIMRECGCQFESGTAFQRMLKLVLATMASNALHMDERLKDLRLEKILERPWIDFRQQLLGALHLGRVGNDALPGQSEQVMVEMQVSKEESRKLSLDTTDAVLGLLRDEHLGESDNQVKPHFVQGQREYVQRLFTEIAKEYTHRRSSSHKEVPVKVLHQTLTDAFNELVTHRTSACFDWMKQRIQNQPFEGKGTREKCRKLINSLRTQWTFCAKSCQVVHPVGCRYWCLLPRFHSGDFVHDCLDPKNTHMCEHFCRLCQFENEKNERLSQKKQRLREDIRLCKKPAGHQHDQQDGEAKLHICEERHLCEKPCSLEKARGCSVGGKNTLAGKCTRRLDHDSEDSKGTPCLCDVPWEEHRCPEPCQLSNYGCCSSEKNCEKLFGERDHGPHLCGNEHKCLELCQKPGVCMLSKSESVDNAEKIGKGANGFHKRCKFTVQPDSTNHSEEGDCYCGTEHTCDKMCPFCKHFCT